MGAWPPWRSGHGRGSLFPPTGVDKLTPADTNASMNGAMAAAGGRKRALIAGVAACLLLLRALILVLSAEDGTLLHPTSGASAGQTLCVSDDAGSGSPAHSLGDRHCLSCALGERQRALDDLATAPGPAALAASRADMSRIRLSTETFARCSVRSAAPWSSRAPPAA